VGFEVLIAVSKNISLLTAKLNCVVFQERERERYLILYVVCKACNCRLQNFWPLIRLTRVNGSSRQMRGPTGRDFPFAL